MMTDSDLCRRVDVRTAGCDRHNVQHASKPDPLNEKKTEDKYRNKKEQKQDNKCRASPEENATGNTKQGKQNLKGNNQNGFVRLVWSKRRVQPGGRPKW